jgi:outer membrane murein-binding lipoprotein Lpp
MKKLSLILLSSVLLLTACTGENQQNDKLNQLTNETSQLESQKSKLENEITDIKVENGMGKYIITINISQSHFTLDLSQHVKDAINDIEIQLPVDKEFYDSVEVGTILDDSFRVGSLLMNGSFGNWEVKITGKEIK